MNLTQKTANQLKQLLRDYHKYPRPYLTNPETGGDHSFPHVAFVEIGQVHDAGPPTIYDANPIVLDSDTFGFETFGDCYAIEVNGNELEEDFSYLGIRFADHEGLPLFMVESSVVNGLTGCFDLVTDVNLDACTVTKTGFHFQNGVLVDILVNTCNPPASSSSSGGA
jgi:hypothetical protein